MITVTLFLDLSVSSSGEIMFVMNFKGAENGDSARNLSAVRVRVCCIIVRTVFFMMWVRKQH